MVQKIKHLVVDTTAFINNVALQEIATHIVTVQEVVDEITNKRQLRRLVVLPYDLVIKDVFPENVKAVTDFSKKTGDYPSLSATDIKVMALTYQLEKEKVGISHLRSEPLVSRSVSLGSSKPKEEGPVNVSGFYMPVDGKCVEDDEEIEKEEIEETEVTIPCSNQQENTISLTENITDKKNNEISDDDESLDEGSEEMYRNVDEDLSEKFKTLDCEELEDTIDGQKVDDILTLVNEEDNCSESNEENSESGFGDDDGWITPSNVQKAKKQMNDDFVEDKPATVACITTDFAMQNVLKQMNLNVAALDGRMIKQIRTFILRCYTCFKTTSLMDKKFCQKCGNKTLKKVSVSLDQNGKQIIHINTRRPLTARGKKYSLPTFKGGKHSNNPLITEDQPLPQQRPSRQARMKNNPMDPDYIAGFSPFVMRDVNSRSALLGIRPGKEVKHWMQKNPNEARRKRK